MYTELMKKLDNLLNQYGAQSVVKSLADLARSKAQQNTQSADKWENDDCSNYADNDRQSAEGWNSLADKVDYLAESMPIAILA